MFHTSDRLADNKLARAARVAVVHAILYFCADRLLNVVGLSAGWTILWPLNGVTIALLLMRPREDWPVMLFGVALGTGAGEFFDNPLGVAILQRLLSVTEVVLSALILPRFTTLDEWLRRPHVYRRFCVALLLGPGLSGILAAILAHHITGQAYRYGFNDWATADALGIAVTMPLALSLRSPDMRSLFKSYALARTLCITALAVALCVLVFVYLHISILFTIFPALFLVDSTLGFAGSALVMPIACLIAVFGQTTGRGPFSHLPSNFPVSSSVALQIFLGFQALALFPASIQIRHRRQLEVELQQRSRQLATLASLDGLTGVPNRRSLDEHFAAEWKLAERAKQPLTLLMIDIDHFKQFNDLYGHHAGDFCLRKIANLLATDVRRSRDMAARFGGEEFAVLLPDTEEAGVRAFAERIFRAIEDLHIPHEASSWRRVTISAGCAARTPGETQSPEDLLKLADGALYNAKRSGRNHICFDFPGASTEPTLIHDKPAVSLVLKD